MWKQAYSRAQDGNDSRGSDRTLFGHLTPFFKGDTGFMLLPVVIIMLQQEKILEKSIWFLGNKMFHASFGWQCFKASE